MSGPAGAAADGHAPPRDDGDGDFLAWLTENVEAVLVAVVMALIIRHFCIEAFKIPTGSMAPTLYGAHHTAECDSCGMVWARNDADREVVCPNCVKPVSLPERPEITGDRILVDKFTYTFREPRRFEVIVFAFPSEPWRNYIKRLAGKPGETLEIIHGDLHVNGAIAAKPEQNPQAQEALWQFIHDSTLLERDTSWAGRTPAWNVTAGDGGREGTAVHLQPTADAGEARAVFARPITSANFYNSRADRLARTRRISDFEPVGDIRVRARVTVPAGAAAAVEIDEDGRVYRLDLPAGERPRVTALEGGPEVLLEDAGPTVPAGRPFELTFYNCDDRLSVVLDGVELPLTPTGAAPAGDPVSSGVRLAATGGDVTFDAVRLDRDVYYENQGRLAEGRTWTVEGGFVCLGDNSASSSDSRGGGFGSSWVVPRSNVVGRAFIMFWPLWPAVEWRDARLELIR